MINWIHYRLPALPTELPPHFNDAWWGRLDSNQRRSPFNGMILFAEGIQNIVAEAEFNRIVLHSVWRSIRLSYFPILVLLGGKGRIRTCDL